LHPLKTNWSRRHFVQTVGSIAALTAAEPIKLVAAQASGVSIISLPGDSVANSAPAVWAARELEHALTEQHVKTSRPESLGDAPAGDLCVIVAGRNASLAGDLMRQAEATISGVPESLALVPGTIGSRKVILACGSDPRGLVYALRELADRVRYGTDPITAIAIHKPVLEQPTNKVRSINRCVQSEVEDRPWFNDKAMWSAYLAMLVTQRFNRFNLTLGLGYDYPQTVTDSYLYFTYPFLVSVPGYDVRAAPLSDRERDNNLEMLRFISDEAADRGLDFQLGLWNHAYVMSKNSTPTYAIEGLTPETHAPYCRDALYTLLKACPGISGLTLRVHGESGIPEGDFGFWDVVFQGIGKLDRKIEVNLHAKGITEQMINIATSTKMPITISPKYWAEHLGLPYQQSSIRELEMPPVEPAKEGFFEISSGARRFLRYSYGDLFKKSRPYDIIFRIWPGTQRTLLWGDPKLAAADGRAAHFCGSLGIDLFEPLSFKGRGGSGVSSAPGGRCAYADNSLTPRYDWEKFLYSYRVWGRHIYNPDANPEACYRFWNKQLGMAGPAISQALSNASRILRIVTVSHEPSAANWTYWPEMYTNMPIVDEAANTLYRDTPTPRVFDNVSPLDPQMFCSIAECVSNMLKGDSNFKYTPLEVASWLEKYANAADSNLSEARIHAKNIASPEYRRVVLDVQIQSGLGKFFAWKIRSGALFAIYQATGDHAALEQAVSAYRKARYAWASMANQAKGVYMNDITYGGTKNMRGHWLDRLPGIDSDIGAMQALLVQAPVGAISNHQVSGDSVPRAIREVFSPPMRPTPSCRHTPATTFTPGTAQTIELQTVSSAISAVRLKYRHVNQGEYYQAIEMQARGPVYRGVIPSEHTKSEYAIQYFFEIETGAGRATSYPGLGPDLTSQPYYVVEQA
jgi:hypothetical protein